MHIYLIMLLPALLFAKLASNVKPYPVLKSTYYTFAVLSFLPFAINSMFRGQVGTDWIIYDAYYYEISNGGRSFSEPLFNILNRMLYAVSHNSVLLFAVVGFLTLLFFFIGIFQQSEMIAYSILLFFLTGKYFSSLNQIRQMLAMSIFFFAFRYIRERRSKKYFFWIFVACLIHSSSVIYAPLYFLYGARYSTKRLAILAFGYCFCLPVLSLLAPVLVGLTSYGWYLDSRFDQNNFDIVGFAVSLLIFCFHLFLLRRREKIEDDRTAMETGRENGFMTMICLFSCLLYLLTNALPQVTRVAESYSVIQILSLPNMVKKEKNVRFQAIVLCTVAGIFACKLLYNVYGTQWWYGVLPYHTFFYE